MNRTWIIVLGAAAVAYFIFAENRPPMSPAKPDPFSPAPQNTVQFQKEAVPTQTVRAAVPAELL